MKLIDHFGFHFSLAFLCLGLTGCASQRLAAPLGSGYERVAHPTRTSLDDPEATRISLEYRQPDGSHLLIWPSLYGVNEVVKGEVVIFVGDKAYVHADPDDPRGVKPRLFAARAPGLPLDITDDVLRLWSKATGKDFATARAAFSMVYPEAVNDRLRLRLIFLTDEKDWPDPTTLQLDWNQMSDLMRAVKAEGTLHKDLRWGTPYLEKS